MNTPLTPGMSALLEISEDNLDYHEYFPLRPDTNTCNGTTNLHLPNLTFDSNSNKPFNGEYNNYAQIFLPNQLSLQNQYEAPPPVNDSLGETADNPFLNDFLTTSMFQIPTDTTPPPFTNNDSIDNGTIRNHDNQCKHPAFAASELVRDGIPNNLSDIPFVPNHNRHPSESSRNGQQSFDEVNISPYDVADLQRQPYVASQPQYHYDAFGNVVSPLRVMNEQYELQQLNQSAFLLEGLDPSYLVPPPPLPNPSPPSFEKRAPKSSTSKSNNHLVPPPPLPPAPPSQPGDPPVRVKRRRRRKPPPPPEIAAAKHKAFLRRNREAASKCRTKKKAQTNDLEDEERMGRQINAVLKDEFKDLLGEAIMLRKQVKEMRCDENCEGCGEHAPIRRYDVLVTSSIGNSSIGTGSIHGEEEEDEDDGNTESVVGSLQSPLSVDSRFQSFNSNDDFAMSETTAGDNNETLWDMWKLDELDATTYRTTTARMTTIYRDEERVQHT